MNNHPFERGGIAEVHIEPFLVANLLVLRRQKPVAMFLENRRRRVAHTALRLHPEKHPHASGVSPVRHLREIAVGTHKY